MHKWQLTHLFLNQLLLTPSSVPLAVPLSVPLAADCPLSPADSGARLLPWHCPGVVLPSAPHEPTVPSRGRCWGSPSSGGLRGALGMGFLQAAGFGPMWMQDRALRRCPESLQPAECPGLSGINHGASDGPPGHGRVSKGLFWEPGRAPGPRAGHRAGGTATPASLPGHTTGTPPKHQGAKHLNLSCQALRRCPPLFTTAF